MVRENEHGVKAADGVSQKPPVVQHCTKAGSVMNALLCQARCFYRERVTKQQDVILFVRLPACACAKRPRTTRLWRRLSVSPSFWMFFGVDKFKSERLKTQQTAGSGSY